MPKLALHAGHVFIVNTARHNVVEVIQVGIHIKRKPMHGNPAAAAHTHGTNFPCFGLVRINPHSGVARIAIANNTVLGNGADDGFLEETQVLVNVGEEVLEVENWIPHNLAWSVVGNVATAVDFVVRSAGSF